MIPVFSQYRSRRIRPHTSSSYSSAVLADSPVAYYRLGESSGTVANDSSGNGHAGTYTGGFTLGQTGLIVDPDTCVLFNGTTGYVSETTVNSVLAGAQHATLEAWVNRASTTDTCQIGCNTTTGYRFEYSWHSDGNLYTVAENGGTVGAIYTALGGTGTHYIALTYDGTQATDGARITIYIDGSPVSNVNTGIAGSIATSLASAVNLGTFYIGHDAGSSLFFNGECDEVALYTTTLSSTRIAAHYAAGI